MDNQPKVSFVLLAYNQERFIEDAILSITEIDYKNIEIIISDDASTDNTYKIIEEVVKKNGFLKNIVLLKSEENLGIAKHLNKVLGLATGELIFLAAGDDVSYKDRVRVVVDAWLADGRQADAICSSVDLIDESGHKIGFIPANKITGDLREELKFFFSGFLGCSEVITRRLVDRFPIFDCDLMMEKKVFSEDRVFALRAFLMGGVLSLPVPLVGYRITGGSASNNIAVKIDQGFQCKRLYRIVELNRCLDVLNQYDRDVERLVGLSIISSEQYLFYKSVFRERVCVIFHQLGVTSDSFGVRLLSLFFLFKYFKWSYRRFFRQAFAMAFPRRFLLRFP